jgi:uroporphyrinogen decarboxylase
MAVEMDLERFWAENALCTGKAFRTDKPRAPIGLSLDDHWLFGEMQLPSTVRYYEDADYCARINSQCNDRCEAAIGIRPLPQSAGRPGPLRIEQVLGSRIELTEGGTPWLEPGVESIDDLRAMLGRVEKLDEAGLRELIFGRGGVVEKEALNADGSRKTRRPGSRGPATIGTSVIGTTRYLYWLIDYPADMEHFYEVLGEMLIRYHRVLERESNVQYRGYFWLDDNCALLSPRMYEHFCFPVMKRVFDEFAARPDDYRYQHSDSGMAHLLPILSRLEFHGVNLGPTVPAGLIRRHMPRTEIHGQIAPNTVRNGTLEEVVGEVRRDFAAVGGDGGLLITTAGSISAGTTLESIRGFMWAVQQYARYDATRH